MRALETGAGIIAYRRLRRMRPILLKTMSHSETAWVGWYSTDEKRQLDRCGEKRPASEYSPVLWNDRRRGKKKGDLFVRP
jgi:hypothetical protein